MGDLTVSEADLGTLGTALARSLGDLEALRRSLRNLDMSAVGARPLTDAERTYARTRHDDLTALGAELAARQDEIDRVVPTLTATDHRLAGQARQSGPARPAPSGTAPSGTARREQPGPVRREQPVRGRRAE
jgi:hypothetical protein